MQKYTIKEQVQNPGFNYITLSHVAPVAIQKELGVAFDRRHEQDSIFQARHSLYDISLNVQSHYYRELLLIHTHYTFRFNTNAARALNFSLKFYLAFPLMV